MKKVNVIGAALASFALAGCHNSGDELALQSRQYAQCVLENGDRCTVDAPAGATVEKTTVAHENDAVRMSGEVKTESECKGFVRSAKDQGPKYVVQTVVNGTVVTPYGDITIPTSVDSACAKDTHKVSVTVMKAP